jgi:fido (protein-threonine AMPylation protein)
LALAQPRTFSAQCRAIAFFHAKFERIHPFKDGNGRVGRALLDSQRNAFFGLSDRRKPIESSAYRAALTKAQRKSNLRPFINLLLGAEHRPLLPNTHEQLPFLLKPCQGSVEEKKKRRRAAKNFEW